MPPAGRIRRNRWGSSRAVCRPRRTIPSDFRLAVHIRFGAVRMNRYVTPSSSARRSTPRSDRVSVLAIDRDLAIDGKAGGGLEAPGSDGASAGRENSIEGLTDDCHFHEAIPFRRSEPRPGATRACSDASSRRLRSRLPGDARLVRSDHRRRCGRARQPCGDCGEVGGSAALFTPSAPVRVG